MRCKFISLINSYADGRLKPDKAASLEEHLKYCPECAKELEFIRALSKGIKENRIQTHPEYFWQAIKERLILRDREKERAREVSLDFGKWASRLIPVPVAIAIIAMITLNALPKEGNLVDEYIFGSGNGTLTELFDEPANQLIF